MGTCDCCGGFAPNKTPELADAYLLVDLGASVLNHVTTTITLGHSTPPDSLSYIQRTPDPNRSAAPLMVTDLIAWSGRRGDWEPARQRLTHYVKASGWQEQQLRGIAEALTSP